MLAHADRIAVPGREPSTSSAPAATARTPSTSRRWRRSSSPAAGARVVKHGNRAASSSSRLGRRARGARRRPRPAARRGSPRSPTEAGITFCFAQVFHPALAARGGRPRASWASATVFNFLGPLTNPAQPPTRRSACADARMAPLMAGVFASRGRDARWSSAATTGSTSSTTGDDVAVWWVRGGFGDVARRRPGRLGLVAAADVGAARRRRGVQRRRGPRRCSPASRGRCATRCCSTRGCALALTGTDSGSPADAFEADVRAAMARAAAAVDSGAATRLVESWVAATRSG